MNFKTRMQIAIISSLILLSGLVFYFWSKSEYHPNEAINVAQEFLHHLELQELPAAYALTVQNNEYVGKTLTEFSSLSSKESCKSVLFKSTFPFQSNGNRLRRWLAGKEVDMLEVSVEFECWYPYRVTLRRVDGGWKVFYFGAHAG